MNRNRTLGIALATTLLGLGLSPTGAAGQPWEPPLHHVFPAHRGRIGIEIQSMTPELREHMKAPSDQGLLVSRVKPGSAGERAGLKVGDVIVSAGGDPLLRPFDLVRRIGRVPEGDVLELGVVRDGEEQTLEVNPEGAAMPWIDPDHWGEWIERGMREGSEHLRDQLRELERRLEELERKMEQTPPADSGKAT